MADGTRDEAPGGSMCEEAPRDDGTAAGGPMRPPARCVMLGYARPAVGTTPAARGDERRAPWPAEED